MTITDAAAAWPALTARGLAKAFGAKVAVADFNIDVPRSCPGVPESVLDPRSTWPDPAKYDEQARKLAQMFVDNFKTFEKDVAPSVKDAGPKV